MCFYYVVIFSHGKWAKLIYLAVSAVTMHWAEEGSAFSARNLIYLADFDTGMGVNDPLRKKDLFKGSCGQIQRKPHFAELTSRSRVLSRLLTVEEYIELTQY